MIRKLAACVREYKKHAILAPLLITMEVVMEVVIPLLMANLIDFGINASDMAVIWKTGIALVLSAAISLVFGALSGRSAAFASAGFAKNLCHDMYEHVQEFSFANIDKFSSASIVTRLTTDVTNVQNAFQMIIRTAVRSPIMLVFSLIMAFQMNPELSLIFLGAIPVLGIGLYLIIRKVHPTFERVFRTFDHLNRVVQENLRGIRVVKSYVREDHEKEKFNEVSQSIFKDFSYAEKLLALNSPLMQFCMYSCILLISWLGAKLIVGSTMTTGQLMSLLSYAGQILSSLMMLSMIFVMITISKASTQRIVELLDEEVDLVNGDNPVTNVPNGAIAFRDVSFSYAKDMKKLCLKDINLDIKAGSTVGILGGTGSGKSSFVQMIPRLYDATQGQVLVGGIDVKRYDMEALREQVAMVLQKNILFSGTILENLRWGNENATLAEVRHACKLAQADAFIMEFPDGYETHLEQGGTNVSGGQKQRLCIARAILKKPQILILDDSTSAVDTKTDAMIRKAFREQLPNTTKLIIAQRIASIEDADMILVMDNGAIVDQGSHDKLMASSPIYQEVYHSQLKGGMEHDA